MKFIERFSRKSVQQPPSSDSGQAPLLMALEPRIMFDASVGVVAQDAASQTTVDATKDSTSYQESSQSPAASASTDGRAQQAQRSEVVFVDGQVNDLTQLLSGLSANAEVVILDPSKDGLQQMADYLKGREGLDAIHLLSHGSDGMVQIGNFWLASNNLAEHRAALESIGSALKADGDLMLYGCRTGDGEKARHSSMPWPRSPVLTWPRQLTIPAQCRWVATGPWSATAGRSKPPPWVQSWLATTPYWSATTAVVPTPVRHC